MKRIILVSAVLTVAAFAVTGVRVVAQDGAAVPMTTRPAGWGMTGDNPGGYDVALDTAIKHGGNTSATLRAKPAAVADKFGSLVSSIRPDKFRGKRVRFSGYLKTNDVGGHAAMWIRIDGPNIDMLDFSNMDERPIKGTSDWKRYDLVVDVPANAEAIVYGAFLRGQTGQMWIDDVELVAVGSNVAKTSNPISEQDRREMEEEAKKIPKEEIDKTISKYRQLPVQPVNLDFEQLPAMPIATPKRP